MPFSILVWAWAKRYTDLGRVRSQSYFDIDYKPLFITNHTEFSEKTTYKQSNSLQKGGNKNRIESACMCKDWGNASSIFYWPTYFYIYWWFVVVLELMREPKMEKSTCTGTGPENITISYNLPAFTTMFSLYYEFANTSKLAKLI